MGLAGSSAIVTAAFQCLMAFYQLGERDIPKALQPDFVLSVEMDELFIQAARGPALGIRAEGYLECGEGCLECGAAGRVSRVSAVASRGAGAQVRALHTSTQACMCARVAYVCTCACVCVHACMCTCACAWQAGLQDRVIQRYEGCMYMDFAQRLLEERGYGEYVRLPIEHLPLLWLAYLSDPSNSGKMHNDVKSRWLQGDEHVLAAMREFGALTDRAREALDGKDWKALAEAMCANFALRRRLYGEAALGDANLKMVAVAEEAGLPVKFPGSGGAVVGMATTEEVCTYSYLLLPLLHTLTYSYLLLPTLTYSYLLYLLSPTLTYSTLATLATLPTVPPAVPPAVPTEPHLPRPPPRRRGEEAWPLTPRALTRPPPPRLPLPLPLLQELDAIKLRYENSGYVFTKLTPKAHATP